MANEPNWNLNCLDFNDNSKCRFINVSRDDVDKLIIAQQKNEKTKRKTMYDLFFL